MTEDGRYATQVKIVKQECPDADEGEIVQEFRRYEEEFLIPPEDALRSVVRKFQAAAGMEQTKISAPSRAEMMFETTAPPAESFERQSSRNSFVVRCAGMCPPEL